MVAAEQHGESLGIDEVARPAEAQQVAVAGRAPRGEIDGPLHLDDLDFDAERAPPHVGERHGRPAVIGARVGAERELFRRRRRARALPGRAGFNGELLAWRLAPAEARGAVSRDTVRDPPVGSLLACSCHLLHQPLPVDGHGERPAPVHLRQSREVDRVRIDAQERCQLQLRWRVLQQPGNLRVRHLARQVEFTCAVAVEFRGEVLYHQEPHLLDADRLRVVVMRICLELEVGARLPRLEPVRAVHRRRPLRRRVRGSRDGQCKHRGQEGYRPLQADLEDVRFGRLDRIDRLQQLGVGCERVRFDCTPEPGGKMSGVER